MAAPRKECHGGFFGKFHFTNSSTPRGILPASRLHEQRYLAAVTPATTALRPITNGMVTAHLLPVLAAAVSMS